MRRRVVAVGTRAKWLYALAMFAAVSAASADAWACSVCYGDPNSPMVQGMKAGIFVLLGCIGTVLLGFASLFVYWIYRSRNVTGSGFDQGVTS